MNTLIALIAGFVIALLALSGLRLLADRKAGPAPDRGGFQY